jgi:hypothetical protein
MMMRSPCAGDALDPRYRKFLMELSLSLSLSEPGPEPEAQARRRLESEDHFRFFFDDKWSREKVPVICMRPRHPCCRIVCSTQHTGIVTPYAYLVPYWQGQDFPLALSIGSSDALDGTVEPVLYQHGDQARPKPSAV